MAVLCGLSTQSPANVYGKIFTQIYDGSLYGRWQALVTFQQLIVLADKDGTVDMTIGAIAARTSIPLEIIEQGITELERPDPNSRTPDEEGRRIIRVSDARTWGWTITNYAHYRAIRTAEERREYFKQHKRKQRAAKKIVTGNVTDVTSPVTTQSPPLSTSSPQIPPIVVSSKQEAEADSSSSARETLLQRIPVKNRFAWECELKSAVQGMHGPALTAEQVEEACRDYIGNGASATPNLKHFRGYLRRAPAEVSRGRTDSNNPFDSPELRAWAAEQDAKEKASG